MKLASKLLAMLAIGSLGLFTASTAHALPITVTVEAGTTREGLWTDTGIDLTGETICITATGTWYWAFGEPVGPDGEFVPSEADEWLQNHQHGQLIAYVGADPLTGLAGLPGSTDFIAIGSSGTISGLTGRLWLGFNDDYESEGYGDNSGSVQATITSCPDGGSTVALLGLALGGMAYVRRKLVIA